MPTDSTPVEPSPQRLIFFSDELARTGVHVALLLGMTDQERQTADTLLSRIEIAVGALPDRSGPNAALIKTIIESVNGLRSVFLVVRSH